jgi:hypothetical protein
LLLRPSACFRFSQPTFVVGAPEVSTAPKADMNAIT